MNIVDIITKKRNKEELNELEIKYFRTSLGLFFFYWEVII